MSTRSKRRVNCKPCGTHATKKHHPSEIKTTMNRALRKTSDSSTEPATCAHTVHQLRARDTHRNRYATHLCCAAAPTQMTPLYWFCCKVSFLCSGACAVVRLLLGNLHNCLKRPRAPLRSLAVDPTAPSNPNLTSSSSVHPPEAAPRTANLDPATNSLKGRGREAPSVLVVVTAAVRVVVIFTYFGIADHAAVVTTCGYPGCCHCYHCACGC